MTSDNYELYWEASFERSLVRVGLTMEVFERLAENGVARLLHFDPFEPKSTFEIVGTNHRYVHTRYRFPDLPAMLIAYHVDPISRIVTVKGVEAVWDEDLAVP